MLIWKIHKLICKKKYGDFQPGRDGKVKIRNLMVPDYILKSAQKRIRKLLNKRDFPEGCMAFPSIAE